MHGISLEAQEQTLKEWCQQNGHNIVGIYREEGISGKKPPEKRPALQNLLSDLQYGQIKMIVFCKLDRWFRSVKEYYKVQDVLDKYKVCWRTVQEDYETETASGRFKVNIMLSVAEDEADRTSERIKTVMNHKQAKGEAKSGKCPLGYKIVDKKFAIDEQMKDIVYKAFEIYKNTHSTVAVYDYLRPQGLFKSFDGTRKFLHNVSYTGEFYGVKDYAPAYFSEEEWAEIQSLKKNLVRKTKENRVYLFSGILFCGECRMRMHCGTRTINGKEYITFVCPGAIKNKRCKNNHYVNEYTVEDFLLNSIDDKFSKLKASVKTKTTDHKKDITRLEDKKQKLKDLYVNDLISMDELKKKLKEIDSKMIEYKKDTLQFDLRPLEELLSVGWIEMYSKLEKCDKARFWKILLKEIVIYENGNIEYFFNQSYSNNY